MLISSARQKGVSLIELMIGLAIMAILLSAGLPSFNLWIQNTQNRTAAESIQNGLQLARTEAVRRNTNVRFDLTDATGLIGWNVGCVTATADCPATIQSHAGSEGTTNARAGISTAAIPSPAPANQFDTAVSAGTGLPAGATFNGLGRIPNANIGTDISRIDITNIVAATARRLVVTVGTGGSIRMCDPALSLAANPQGCS
ncbi:MAG: GspH/FimT family pseudopilin [Sulfuricella sp.]|nr:GspH/FimT family pseudopilin [Sulfuricella sp.]